MKIVVSSQSPVKLQAVRNACAALGLQADIRGVKTEITGVKAKSGVSEQPVEKETEDGARNRLAHARQLSPGADLYISIESGIFRQNGKYVDVAVIYMQRANGTELPISHSAPVEFPSDCVEEAFHRRAAGEIELTAGMVMEEKGIVTDNKDPHLSLTGKSRAVYITESVKRLLPLAFQPASRLSRSP